MSGLANDDFSDFEDCLQSECAKSYGADYIVTRNISDYVLSDIKAILPREYLKLLQYETTRYFFQNYLLTFVFEGDRMKIVKTSDEEEQAY